jgi:hypothetical protein
MKRFLILNPRSGSDSPSSEELREAAEERGVELVFADNDVLPLPGESDLDEAVRRLMP